MTIKDLYDAAVEKGFENCPLNYLINKTTYNPELIEFNFVSKMSKEKNGKFKDIKAVVIDFNKLFFNNCNVGETVEEFQKHWGIKNDN